MPQGRPYVGVVAGALTIAFALACGDAAGPGDGAGAPASLQLLDGDAQPGVVAGELPAPLRVRVTDGKGRAVARASVAFQVLSGGGSLVAASATDSLGVAAARWTLGTSTADSQRVQAAVVGAAAVAPVTFRATALAGPPVSLAAEPDAANMDALGDTLRVRVQGRDRFGNASSRVRDWRSSNDAAVVVDTAGLLRSVGNGTATIVASAGVAADSVQVTVRQVPVGLLLTPAAATVNAIGDTLRLRGFVADRNGREVAGEPVQWSSSDPAVAEVGPGGVLISRSVGRTTIRVTSRAFAAEVDVLVRQVLAALRLQADAAGLREGDTLRATPSGADSNGVAMPLPTLAWISSRPDVADVADGLVTGVRFGASEVSAGSGGVTGRLTLNVVTPYGRIGGGYYHTCALDAEGRALCWGLSDEGQLGHGLINYQAYATPQIVAGNRRYVSISVSERFACALTATGEAYCWGRNAEKQVGDGTTISRAVPTLVRSAIAFKSVVVGERHACALDGAGRAYCWGTGAEGVLGNGGTQEQPEPAPVLGGLTFRSLVSGNYHVCGIASDGLTYCWGYSYWGATGRGTGVGIQPTPLPVLGNQRFVQIAAGYLLTCGVTADRSLYCWGTFNYPWGTSPPPMGVPTLHPGRYVAVSVGFSVVCGYAVDMKLHCWGGNDRGQLGLGTSSVDGGEGDVAGGHTFVSAGMGQTHTCALTPAGEAFCWGSGTFGQRGDGTTAGSLAPAAPVASSTPFR